MSLTVRLPQTHGPHPKQWLGFGMAHGMTALETDFGPSRAQFALCFGNCLREAFHHVSS